MKAAIYLRVSTEEQRNRESIEVQREFAQRYCDLHKIAIHDVYADDGISGTVAVEERAEGKRLMRDARGGNFDVVLVYKLDRLGLDPLVILNAVAAFEASGAQVKSMTEAFDTADPAGRLLLTILSGTAGFERDTIAQRSMEGTHRLVREGAWVGGIVPFGYRIQGQEKRRAGTYVIAEDAIPGLSLSEAGVVRMVYDLMANEGLSCVKIADRLNALGVPTVYKRDERDVHRAKRQVATAGIWRAGRVRSLIINPMYKGLHQYGKRSKRQRESIERNVPAIVDADMWERAQQRLHDNMRFSPKNAKHRYLLRGLVKCGQCNLTYSGQSCHSSPRDIKYYVCNGYLQARGLYGRESKRCPSIRIRADMIETAVWKDIEGFLRNPGEVLEQLRARARDEDNEGGRLREELLLLRQAHAHKAEETKRILNAYRRELINDADLAQQLQAIRQEAASLEAEIQRQAARIERAELRHTQIENAEELLGALNSRLDAPLTWELQRQLIETLVESIQVITTEDDRGKKAAEVEVVYRFVAANHTDTGSVRPPG